LLEIPELGPADGFSFGHQGYQKGNRIYYVK
jgi:hypothetical protein